MLILRPGGGGGSDPLCFDTEPGSPLWTKAGPEWIGGHGQLRGEFSVPSNATVKRARIYATGVGAYYLRVNGVAANDHVMDPPQTVYPKRMLFTSHDVTKHIKAGQNVIGVLLGNVKWGYTDLWCNVRCHLAIAADHADGP